VIVATAPSTEYRIVEPVGDAVSASGEVLTRKDGSGAAFAICLLVDGNRPRVKEMSIRPESDLPDAARAVGALLAPVVACLRGDDEGVRVLLDDACESGSATDAVRAAPAIVRIYLRLAPPPDSADGIVREFPDAAIQRFGDPQLVTLGMECLHVARVPEPVETLARAVFVDDALSHGDRHALEGAIASCWWCALRSARLRDVDPIAEAAAICRYVARQVA
jgi:hypothetical protein